MRSAAHAKMVKARSALVLDHPFFASLALRLELREDSSCATAWCDGRVLGFNPAYVEALPLEAVMGVQCHEVLHMACHHHTRRRGRDPRLWNRACDYAVNHILLDAGIRLPNGYLDDPDLRHRSVDAIYRVLADIERERKGGYEGDDLRDGAGGEDVEGGGGAGLGGPGEKGASPGGPDEDAVPPDTLKAGDAAGAAVEPDPDADPDADADPGGCGEVRDAAPGAADGGEGASDPALAREEEAWSAALARAANMARECGRLPGAVGRLVGDALSPPLPWDALLRRFLADAARNDFSWVRPNVRHLHAGLHLPGLHSRELAEVAVAVDTSGSITPAQMDRFAAELSAVLEEYEAAITVLTCDAALTGCERMSRADLPLSLAVRGGGGTDFRPPFERLEREGIEPACLIYFTDLESDRFPEEPGYPVLWVCPDAACGHPPFGERLVME
ncbi:MAG: hypothetical protein H0S85_05730 [Desulfovibrionaceae bacterium]|jgi:predicted metal-dependent peptidase|nr:hypothetical protein [Desulfovibrionaceae bacterium]